jgi:DNA-binding transcriptional MerR regulator
MACALDLRADSKDYRSGVTAYRIAELAESSGFPTTTLRYYEQVGLLEPPERTPSGYRVYDDGAVHRLAFIDRAKRMGFALDEIVELVRLWADGDCPPVQHRMQALLDARRASVRQQIEQLSAFAGQLDEVAGRLDESAASDRCGPGCGCEVTVSTPAVRAVRRPLLTPAHDREPVPIACSLDDVALAGRLADWRAVADQALETTRTATGVRLRLPAGAALAAKIAELASAEASCCPFLTVTLTVGDRELEVHIDAAPGGEEMAHQLIEPAGPSVLPQDGTTQGTSLPS